MKLAILGASGGVGQHLTRLAALHHEVTALVRPATLFEAPVGVRVVRGEAHRGESLDDAIAGTDAVLCAIGMRRRAPSNPWSRNLSPTDLVERTVAHVTASMKRHGVTRIAVVSAAGVGDSAARLNLLMRFMLATTMIGTAYRDLARAEAHLAESGLDWLAPRPTRLIDAPAHPVAVTARFGMADHIGREAVATWMLDALAHPWPRPEWASRTPQITKAQEGASR